MRRSVLNLRSAINCHHGPDRKYDSEEEKQDYRECSGPNDGYASPKNFESELHLPNGMPSKLSSPYPNYDPW